MILANRSNGSIFPFPVFRGSPSVALDIPLDLFEWPRISRMSFGSRPKRNPTRHTMSWKAILTDTPRRIRRACPAKGEQWAKQASS